MIISSSSFSTVFIVERWKGILCNVIKPLFAYKRRHTHTHSFQHTHHAKGLIVRGGNDVLFKFNNMVLNTFDCLPQKKYIYEINFLLQLWSNELLQFPRIVFCWLKIRRGKIVTHKEENDCLEIIFIDMNLNGMEGICLYTTAYGNDYIQAYRHISGCKIANWW